MTSVIYYSSSLSVGKAVKSRLSNQFHAVELNMLVLQCSSFRDERAGQSRPSTRILCLNSTATVHVSARPSVWYGRLYGGVGVHVFDTSFV